MRPGDAAVTGARGGARAAVRAAADRDWPSRVGVDAICRSSEGGVLVDGGDLTHPGADASRSRATPQVMSIARTPAPVSRHRRRADVACGFRDHALSVGGFSIQLACRSARPGLRGTPGRAGNVRSEAGRADHLRDGWRTLGAFRRRRPPFLKALWAWRIARRSDRPWPTRAGPARTLGRIFPAPDRRELPSGLAADDRRGWSQLAGRAPRGAPKRAGDVANTGGSEERSSPKARVLVCGDDHSSDHDAEFGDLFRRLGTSPCSNARCRMSCSSPTSPPVLRRWCRSSGVAGARSSTARFELLRVAGRRRVRGS